MKHWYLWLGAATMAALAACGGGTATVAEPGDDDSPPTADGGSSSGRGGSSGGSSSGTAPTDGGDGGVTEKYSIGGVVTGLLGSGLVLQNAGEDLPIAADGSFAFSNKLASGQSFAVTVKTQPSAPTQSCSVSAGTGSVANGNVTSIVVNCATDRFTVGGGVTGLEGSGLVLQNNGADDLIVNADTFAFATTVESGAPYAVTVLTQPSDPAQTCTVANGAGTIAAANIDDVAITCTTNEYTVGGTVLGLEGAGLTLVMGDQTLEVDEAGEFAFPTALASGSAFTVTVQSQPTGPVQECLVSGGTWTVGNAAVTSVVINCDTSTFTVSGTATGLAATAVLRINGEQDLEVTANGEFSFPVALASGTPYEVTVFSQPSGPSQTCLVTNASGTVVDAPITNVTLTCTTDSFFIRGTVSGLEGAGAVLRNNNQDDLPLNDDGPFVFAVPVQSGATYDVSVHVQPSSPSQECVVTNRNGSVGGADVNDVQVTCTTRSFLVGGTVTGLNGTGLVLQNEGGDDLAIDGNGEFFFDTPVLSGGAYVVTVLDQPAGPSQTCTVSAGSGTVGNGNVASVAINCSTNSYTFGGTVTGLLGPGLKLVNAGVEVTVNGNGNYAFPALLSGSGYSVSVQTQPASPIQTCTVSNPAGTITGANVTNINVSCNSTLYTFSGIRENVPVSSLNGWTQCYLDRYDNDNRTLAANLVAACSKAKVMLACRSTGSATLQLAAHAARGDVFFDTGPGNVTRAANGVSWYFNTNYSMGFAPLGEPINRGSADTAPGVLRLSWHTHDYFGAGWRCGNNIELNGSAAFERVVYHAD